MSAPTQLDWAEVAAFHHATIWHEGALPEVRACAPVGGERPAGLALPPLQSVSHVSLSDALQMRFSARAFLPQAISLDQLSQVLGTALCQLEGHRFPSAGSLYTAKFYVVATHVVGLARAIFEYLPRTHSLHRLPLERFPEYELARMLGPATSFEPEQGLAGAAVQLLITVDLRRVIERYGKRGYRFALQESGHAAQNLVLSAAAHGLASVTLGSFLDDRAAQALDLPPHELPVYVLPLGHAKTAPDEPVPALVVAAQDAAAPRWLQWRLYTQRPQELMAQLNRHGLEALRTSGEVLNDWYLVKSDAHGMHVRLRLQPSLPELMANVRAVTEASLAACERDGFIERWCLGQYEPEQFLFGGAFGMELVHILFTLDSQASVLAGEQRRARADLISHLWTELLLRFVGLDSFERFDVWSQVSLLRPADDGRWDKQLEQMQDAATAIRQLPTPELVRRFHRLIPAGERLLDDLAIWAREFMVASNGGQLTRGPRQILAVCLIFHWNRMLYGPGEQMFLAQLRLKANQPR